MRNLYPIAIATMLALATSSASAVKLNSYTFNDATAGSGGVIDSISGAHGTLIDPAGTFGIIAGGQIDISRNNGVGSDQGIEGDATNFTEGAYIDLPDDIANIAFNSGTANQATFETWYTVDEVRSWSRLWDFGTSAAGEDASSTALDSIYFTPQAGSGLNASLFESRDGTNFDPGVAQSERVFVELGDPAEAAALPVGELVHVVVTVDGTTPGATDAVNIYHDGVLVGSGAVQPNLPLGEIADYVGDAMNPAQFPVNNWLGRSQWTDPLFDGSYEEFNIYDDELSASEVLASFNAGPVEFVSPTIFVDRSTGEITVVNEEGVAIELSSLTITSGFGALDASELTSPGDFEITAPALSTAIGLNDSNGTGVDLPVSQTPVSLGAIWKVSPFEDLSVEFTTDGGDNGGAIVVYTGDAVARSDFNLDGNVDLADYAIFVANAGSSVSGIDGYYAGDIDFNGVVDRLDFRLFKEDFFAAGGTAAALAEFTFVPEPTSAVLLALGAACGLARRRRIG